MLSTELALAADIGEDQSATPLRLSLRLDRN